MATREIHGVTFTVLPDRTYATLRPGDVVRVNASPIGQSDVWQYLTVMSERADIRASRARRGIPFHRVPSVRVTVRGFNGDITETPENMAPDASGPYYITWNARHYAVGGSVNGVMNYMTLSYDADETIDVYRRASV